MPATNDTELPTEITALGLRYVAGIGPNTSVWPLGTGPLPAPPGKGIGRPPKLLQRDGQHQPISVKALALRLPTEAWQTITWREGSADRLSSRFARQRVRPAHRDTLLTEPRAEEWLLIEWPPEEAEPTKYWFATLPEDTPFETLVDFAKLRWRINCLCPQRRRSPTLEEETARKLALKAYERERWVKRKFSKFLTVNIDASIWDKEDAFFRYH
jgi:SRSO17 transposase